MYGQARMTQQTALHVVNSLWPASSVSVSWLARQPVSFCYSQSTYLLLCC